MSGGGDSCRVVHVKTDVLVANQGRLARVQTDSHADRAGLRPFVRREAPLGVGRRAACVERALEHAEERVAFGSQLGAFPALEGCPQDGVMVDLGLDVRIAQLLHELRRALDVGEEKRDGAAGQGCHDADLATAEPSSGSRRSLSSFRYDSPVKSSKGCGGRLCSLTEPFALTYTAGYGSSLPFDSSVTATASWPASSSTKCASGWMPASTMPSPLMLATRAR